MSTDKTVIFMESMCMLLVVILKRNSVFCFDYNLNVEQNIKIHYSYLYI